MHNSWYSAQCRLRNCSHLVAWNVIIGSALHQFKYELKEKVEDVRWRLEDFANRQITMQTTTEQSAVQDAQALKRECQELYFKLRPKKEGIWGFKC